MDPVTTTVLGAVGAGVSAIGQISAGIAARNEANYQAEVARNNQQIANQNATYAERAGAAQTEAAGIQARARQGALTAALAADNVDVNSGSAEDVRKSEAMSGELTQMNTEQNSLLTAYGYRSQATSFGAQAGLESYAASQAVPAAIGGAFGSLLSSASLLPLKYQWMTSGSNSTAAASPGPGTGGLY